MESAVCALAIWEGANHEGEPEGWNRAKTRNDQGGYDMFRRRPDLTKESEYIAS
jgi:hypothetical protein